MTGQSHTGQVNVFHIFISVIATVSALKVYLLDPHSFTAKLRLFSDYHYPRPYLTIIL